MKRIFGSVRIGILSAGAPALAETFATDHAAPAMASRSLDGGDPAALRGECGR